MKVMWMMTFLVGLFLFGLRVGQWDGIDGEGVLYFSAWEDEFNFEVAQISTCCSGGYTFSRSGFRACRNRSILNLFFFYKKTVKENIESDAKIVRRPSRLVVMTRAKSDSTTSTQQHQPTTTTPQAGPKTNAIMPSALTALPWWQPRTRRQGPRSF